MSISQTFMLLTDFERMPDHCSNIAIEVIEQDENTHRPHKYLLSLRERQAAERPDDAMPFCDLPEIP